MQAFIILIVGLALGAMNGGIGGWLAIPRRAHSRRGRPSSGISNGIALLTRQEATMIAIANFIGLPLLFFSSILIASSLIPGWMRTLVAQPGRVGRTSRARRGHRRDGGPGGLALPRLLLGFAALTGVFATWSFRVYQRTL